jgi:hypothetical protein
MTGSERISAERNRQISVERWTPEHDDKHDAGEMVMAAICYAAAAVGDRVYTLRSHEYRTERFHKFSDPWPWQRHWDKRTTGTPNSTERIRMLEKAGALIAAEIDRLQRSESV